MSFSSLFHRKLKTGSHSAGSGSTSSTRVTSSAIVSGNVTKVSTDGKRDTPHRLRDPDLDYEADYIPKTQEEAQEHINKIREEKGLDGKHSNTSDLENALKVYVTKTCIQINIVVNYLQALRAAVPKINTFPPGARSKCR